MKHLKDPKTPKPQSPKTPDRRNNIAKLLKNLSLKLKFNLSCIIERDINEVSISVEVSLSHFLSGIAFAICAHVLLLSSELLAENTNDNNEDKKEYGNS